MKRATQASLKECRISDVTTRLDLCPLRTIIQPLSSLSGTAKEISKKLDKGDEPAKSLTFIQYPLLATKQSSQLLDLALMSLVQRRHPESLDASETSL
jgi:hypothetical protein